MWTDEAREVYRTPIPKGLTAKARGQLVVARTQAQQIHDSLFPKDE